MNVVGMLRVKNEARWIERVLRSMQSVCRSIWILDDHSTDATAEICRDLRAVVIESPFEGVDETRDKNWLLNLIGIPFTPDWILHIDGDEEIAPGGEQEIERAVKNAGAFDAYRFQVLYLWDGLKTVRVDGVYGNYTRPSLFRFKHGEEFASANGGGFHCGNVPALVGGRPRLIGSCGVKLLHYGYMHKEDRLRKFEWYNAPDKQPIPAVEDGYRHMVIGDIFPAETRTRYGGPLQLKQI